jgi:AcrR family transcriptional regulator
MVQSDPLKAPRALDQARRPRVTKPPDQRRRDILEAATHLFRERGFDMAPVQAIAAEAGVAAGTVYLYFPSKEAILVALREDFEAGLLDRFSQIAEEVLAEEDASGEIVGYREVVDRLVDGIVDFALERRAACEVMARHIGRVPIVPEEPILAGGLTELLARVIREGVRLGYIHTPDPETAAYLLNLAAVTAIGHAIAFEDQRMLERIVRQTKELYIKALAPTGASADEDRQWDPASANTRESGRK